MKKLNLTTLRINPDAMSAKVASKALHIRRSSKSLKSGGGNAVCKREKNRVIKAKISTFCLQKLAEYGIIIPCKRGETHLEN